MLEWLQLTNAERVFFLVMSVAEAENPAARNWPAQLILKRVSNRLIESLLVWFPFSLWDKKLHNPYFHFVKKKTGALVLRNKIKCLYWAY